LETFYHERGPQRQGFPQGWKKEALFFQGSEKGICLFFVFLLDGRANENQKD
jgi:hypothetical protein